MGIKYLGILHYTDHPLCMPMVLAYDGIPSRIGLARLGYSSVSQMSLGPDGICSYFISYSTSLFGICKLPNNRFDKYLLEDSDSVVKS